jgi:hypothetical protein
MAKKDKKPNIIETTEAALNENVKEVVGLGPNYVTSYVQSLMQEDGRAHVLVDLRHGNPIFEPYSSQHDLSRGIFSYVEDVVRYTKIITPLSVDFVITPDKVPLEQTIINEFNGNYEFSVDESRGAVSRCLHHATIMMAIGVFLTSIYIGLNAAKIAQGDDAPAYYEVITEIVSIAGWVFVWDAVDKFSFDRPALRREMLRNVQLSKAQINFIVKDENELIDARGKDSL